MVNPRIVTFCAGVAGTWRIRTISAYRGDTLPFATHLHIVESDTSLADDQSWLLRGVTSHLRYTTGMESKALARVQPPLARPEALRAALIPVRKSAEWWALPQDERRAIYEDRSRHTTIGLEYLPRIARKLHHCRDLGEPFDFLTWFEFAPEHEQAFDELLGRLRSTEEWSYVERDVDIRLTRDGH